MKDSLSKKAKKNKKNLSNTRRSFLKKTAYSAPVVIALGQLVKPSNAHADKTGGPPEAPFGGW